MKTFEKYCEDKKIVLLPWQKEYADKFFEAQLFLATQGPRSGKGFILKVLKDYWDKEEGYETRRKAFVTH